METKDVNQKLEIRFSKIGNPVFGLKIGNSFFSLKTENRFAFFGNPFSN